MAGRFVLDRLLQLDGAGALYLATDLRPAASHRRLEVKVVPARALPLAYGSTPAFWRAQAQRLEALRHPNLVRTLELIEHQGGCLVVSEHLGGVTARQLVDALKARGESVPVRLAVHITAQVLYGLHHAHEVCSPDGGPEPVLHRDVRAENVRLTPNGQVKLAEVGLASLMELTHDSIERARGVAKAFAPERLSNALGPIDARSDVFSAAVMLYELLTGQSPFSGATPLVIGQNVIGTLERPVRELNADVSEALAELLHRGLAKRPTHRHQSALHFASALDQLLLLTRSTVASAEVATLVGSVATAWGAPNA